MGCSADERRAVARAVVRSKRTVAAEEQATAIRTEVETGTAQAEMLAEFDSSTAPVCPTETERAQGKVAMEAVTLEGTWSGKRVEKVARRRRRLRAVLRSRQG